jgi:hypothetical protein
MTASSPGAHEPSSGSVRIRQHAAAVAVYTATTLAFLMPSVGAAPNGLGPNLGDPLLNVYFLEWGAHQIARGLPDPWDAPFFYPTRRVLTLSDHLLGPAAAHLGLRALGLSAPAAYNVLFAATFVLGGWVAFSVLRRSGLSPGGALVGGWSFAFSSYRWGLVGHYQVLRMQWIPAVLWTFDRLLDRPTPGRAAAFLCSYALHVSGGAYLAVLIHFPLAVLLMNRWLTRRGDFLAGARLAVWIPTAAAALGLLLAFYLPYLEAPIALGARHSADVLRRHGATLASFVTPARRALESGLVPLLPAESGRGAFFPGLAVLGLAGLALVRRGRGDAGSPAGGARGKRALTVGGLALTTAGLALADFVTLTGDLRGRYWAPLLLVALGGCGLLAGRNREPARTPGRQPDPWHRGLLASGAVMGLLSLPVFFVVAWSVVPGMRSIRVPTRAFALAAFPLSFLVGSGWDRLVAIAGRGRKGAWVPAAVGLLLFVEALPKVPAWQPIPARPDFPAYVGWIAGHPEVRAYLELPLGREPSWETVPMYLQTAHWRPLANGYSSVLPPSFREVARLCQPLPGPDGLRRLAQLGVTHLVVHWRSPDWQPGPTTRARSLRSREGFAEALRQTGARRVFADADTEIHAIAASE